MHWVLVGVSALAVTVLAVGGVAGIATGWVPPWGRSRVLRPRLLGCGSLTAAVGATVWIFVGPLAGPPHGTSAYVAWAGWVVFMVGLLIQLRSQRPGHGPRTGPTTTAS
ncbi:hypothetical protein ACWD4O_04125 [Streptomyces sp. NPDC002623]